MTTTRQIEANRRNGQLSTGPRTANGKAIARGNSLKHGLCANPAAGIVEDSDAFCALHGELTERIGPTNPIEVGLVHTIAVSLWRNQRAARIDAAMGGLAVDRVVPESQEEIQKWIHAINSAWDVRLIEATKDDLRDWKIAPLCVKWYDRPMKRMRTGLGALDTIREKQMMQSAPALSAMMVMLRDLGGLLATHPTALLNHQAEQLAWLLGDPAARFPEHQEQAASCPWDRPAPSKIDVLIGVAVNRKDGEPMPADLKAMIDNRIGSLQQQRDLCEESYRPEHWRRKRVASLLPDANTLDRLTRYEIHADGRMYRALEMLARIRGATVETVMARVTAPAPGGSTYQLEARRERWEPLAG